MSPTVFRSGHYRAFFFSREEPRVHVHISCPDGEAKFWLEPSIALASASSSLSKAQLRKMQALVLQHADEIAEAWQAHFAGR